MRLKTRAGIAVLLLYFLAALLLFFWPRGDVVHRINLTLWSELRKFLLPRWVSPDHLEQVFNVLVFAFPVLVILLTFPSLRRIWVFAAAALASFAIELTQGEFLPARLMDWTDFMSNVIGAGLGVLIATIVQKSRGRQDTGEKREMGSRVGGIRPDG